MRTLIRLLAIPFLAMSLNSNVFAEQKELNKGWYGTLGLGVAHQLSSYNELNFDLTKWDFENGANLLVSSGCDFNIFSFEGEFTYRKMDIERRALVSGGGDIINDFTGDQTQWSFLFNSFWQPSRELLVSPYLGIGIGVTKISWNNVRVAKKS